MAFTQTLIFIIYLDKGLRFCPVVSLKGVNNSYEKIDSTNLDLYKKQNMTAIQEGALAFTCISGSDSQGYCCN